MLKRLATNAAALAIGGAVAQLAFVSIEIAIARTLGSAEYGIFSTVQAYALAWLIVLDLGTTWWAIESGSKRPAAIGELLGTVLVMKGIGFLILYPAAAAVLVLVGYQDQTVHFFLIYFFYSLTMAIQDSFSAVYTSKQRMVVNGIFQGGAPLIIAIFVALAIYYDLGLQAVGIGYVFGGLILVLFWAKFVWKLERPRVRLSNAFKILGNSYLYGLTGLLTHVFRKGDVLFLSLLTTMPQVGIYAAASKLLDFAYKIPMVGALVVSPSLFKQSEINIESFRSSVDLFIRVNSAAGVLLGMLCFFGADYLIIPLFGTAYVDAIVVVKVLSASFALKFIGYSLQTALTTRGLHAERTRALALSTITAGLLHLALIPRLGAVGAASSVVLAEVLLIALYLIQIDDKRLQRLLISRLATIFLAGGVSTILTFALEISGVQAVLFSASVLSGLLVLIGFLPLGELKSRLRNQ